MGTRRCCSKSSYDVVAVVVVVVAADKQHFVAAASFSAHSRRNRLGTADDDDGDDRLIGHGTAEDGCFGTDSDHQIGAAVVVVAAAFAGLAGEALAAASDSRPWPHRCYY